MKEIGKAFVKIEADTGELDEALEKANRLRTILEEAAALAEELDSKEISINQIRKLGDPRGSPVFDFGDSKWK